MRSMIFVVLVMSSGCLPTENAPQRRITSAAPTPTPFNSNNGINNNNNSNVNSNPNNNVNNPFPNNPNINTVYPSPSPTLGGTTTGDGNIVEFRIPSGTGSNAWNTAQATINLRVGQTLRIYNDDTTTHQLHTNGRPCPHGLPIRSGSSADCRIASEFDPGGSPLYDHISNGQFWFRATR